MNKEETACLTGHRPKFLPWKYDETQNNCKKFKQNLLEIFEGAINFGLKNFLTGMAEGFDMIGAEMLISLRKRFKHIKIIAVVPCLNQEIRWSLSQQKRYKRILKKCDEVIILSERYHSTCMEDRNKYMVDNSSVVIGCYNGKPSGTGNTLRYAKSIGCKIKLINPDDYKIY